MSTRPVILETVAVNRRRGAATLVIVASVTGILAIRGTAVSQESQTTDPAPRVSGAAAPAVPTRTRSDFMGARSCIECHRSEYVSWLGTVHFDNNGINRLDTSNEKSVAAKYKQEHGNLRQCLACHGPPDEDRYGRLAIEAGVSCESCHGASGGPHGWLNRHAVYGPNLTSMEYETPEHLAARQAFCDNAGMVRSGQIYEMAKTCYSCHIVGSETLVADPVGHSSGHELFDLIPWMRGEVRHNFHMNQRVNAEMSSIVSARAATSVADRDRVMFIAAQLAMMEVCLRNLAAVSAEENLEEAYAEAWTGRVDDAKDLIEEIADILEEPDEALNVEPVDVEDLRAIVEAIDELGRRFRDLTRENAATTADIVAQHAKNFVSRHDGSQLIAIDEDFLADPPEPKGKALEP